MIQPLPAPTHNHGNVVVVEGTGDATAIAIAAIKADHAEEFCPITVSGGSLSAEQFDKVLALTPGRALVVS
jgi:hypothetical protein